MPRLSGLLFAMVGVVGLAVGLAGCATGSSSSSTPVATAADTNLNGNWLLTGTLPFVDPLNLGAHGFGIALTFAVEGSQVVAGGTIDYSCGAFVVGGSGSVVTGAIGADGSFTAQPTQTAVSSLQLTGHVPATTSSTWTGTYTFTTGNTLCLQPLTGNFTAVRIADLTGAFAPAGTVSLNSGTLGVAAQPVSLSFNFTQGGTLAGTTQFDPELLSGTVQIQGSPCFKSGATPTGTAGSGLLGNTLVATFTMDDGSSMNLVGDIEDVGTTRLVVHDMLFSGGTCGLMSSQAFEAVRH